MINIFSSIKKIFLFYISNKYNNKHDFYVIIKTILRRYIINFQTDGIIFLLVRKLLITNDVNIYKSLENVEIQVIF